MEIVETVGGEAGCHMDDAWIFCCEDWHGRQCERDYENLSENLETTQNRCGVQVAQMSAQRRMKQALGR